MINDGIVPEYAGKGRKHILVVEKDTLQGYLLKMSLQEQGWSVRLADGPEEALLHCEHSFFDAAIINYNYPGDINGFVLADLLQLRFHLPSLMITASRYVELRSDVAFNPRQPLLYKPYRLMECGPRVNQLLNYRSLLHEHELGS